MAVYKGDGSSTSFPITFAYAGEDTVTGVIEDANGNLKTITSDFYIDSINKTFNYPGYPPGQETAGTTPAVLASGEKLYIIRNTALTQDVSLLNKTPFSSIERGLDKIVLMVQDVNLKHDKTLRLPINAPSGADMTLPLPEPHTTWEWDDTGTKLVKASSPAEATRRAESAAVSAESDKNQAVASASAAAQSVKEAKAVAADMDAQVSGYKKEVETISDKLKSEYSNYSTTLKTQSDQAEKSISDIQTTAKTSINTLQETVISKISSTQNDVLSKIEAANTSAISNIDTAKTDSLTAVNTAQKKATEIISAAQNAATTEIAAEKTNAANTITSLVTETQTNASEAEKSAQAAAKSAIDAAQYQNQADYAETDTKAKSYIKNKPAVFLKTGGKITGNTEIEVPTVGTYNIPLKVQVPNLNAGEGVYLNMGKEGSTYNRFSFGFKYKSSGSPTNAFTISSFSGAEYTFDSTGNAYFPMSLSSPALYTNKLNINGNGITTTDFTATGVTSVPTANAGNKSLAIANTEFVQNAVAGIVDSAPETLNTLKELASALGNDANFSTTITNLIGDKESKTDANVAHEELQMAINTASNNASGATALASAANKTANTLKTTVTGLSNHIDYLDTRVTSLSSDITDAKTAAAQANSGVSTLKTEVGNRYDDLNSKYQSLGAAVDAKQDKLTFDTTPTANSTNPVTSDGIKKAIDAKTVYNTDGHLVFPSGVEMWVENANS